MIERFNFYDVYGYLLPGFALIGLVWVPFGLLSGTLPKNELLSAVGVLAFGYVLGHLLQNLLTTALKSEFRDNQRRRRKPSDIALDSGNKGLSDSSRTIIISKVQQKFGIDLKGTDGEKDLSGRRNHAFFLARSILIQSKLMVYAEQFQGIYAMMRGLTAICFLGSLYLFSWAASLFRSDCLWWVAFILCCAAVVTLVATGLTRIAGNVDKEARTVDAVSLFAIAVIALTIGYILGSYKEVTPNFSWKVAVAGIFCLVSAERFLVAYRYFSFEFAKSIWRDFAACNVSN